jgi:predicted histidine transporter YuiF (NhaC family)
MIVILCPMCKSSIANAENAAELSTTVDTAVLVLLVPTIAIIIGLIGMVVKYRHPQDDEQ